MENSKKDIGIGIVGGGYMGKAHAVAMLSVGAVFNTNLRPKLEMVCATSDKSANHYKEAYGFNAATTDWRELVNNPAVEAIVIASPQATHKEIALAAIALGKPILCEKPVGISAAESKEISDAAKAANVANMVGFNYIRTPASQFARELVANGTIGDVTWFRGEHTEDFYADPTLPHNWRASGKANGTMGDLAPHMINAAMALIGDIDELTAQVETIHKMRPTEDGNGEQEVSNDDQAQMMCRFKNGAMGHLFFSRIATGRKMGYAYEITGTKGAIRFDQEDQNAIWLYKTDDESGQRGFRKILTGPEHPDYVEFCQGPGHGTGYQDQIIIEARDFIKAIETGEAVWPTLENAVEVNTIVDAVHQSNETRTWVKL